MVSAKGVGALSAIRLACVACKMPSLSSEHHCVRHCSEARLRMRLGSEEGAPVSSIMSCFAA